jgi:uncharacterized protein (TIGR04255 family)
MVEEVRLGRSPLSEVICQVRFPAILRIDSEQPAAFQEHVRKYFPQLEIERGLTVEGSPLQAEPPTTQAQPRIFRFSTADDAATLSLTTNFVAVSTTAYRHWQEFAEWVQLAVDALCAVYEPTYARRVGLRYINRITRENTGADSVPELLDILREPLTSVLREPALEIQSSMQCQLLLPVDEDEQLSLRTGFVNGDNPAFMLDLDYFTEDQQIPLQDVLPLCHRYHELVYRAFRWCIKDTQLACFAPLDPGKGV